MLPTRSAESDLILEPIRHVRRALPPLLLTLATSIGACSKPSDYSSAHSDSGIQGPAYETILAELADLEKTHGDFAKVLDYGRTVDGHALRMIRIGRTDGALATTKRPAIVITGSIHGNEYLNIEDRLPRWLLEHRTSKGVGRFLNGGGLIYVAPILNPDGYERRRRENENGKDLNRDFELERVSKRGFTQPETKGLVDALKGELRDHDLTIKVTLDYHCCVGALIYPWGHSETETLPPKELAEHKRLAGMILEDFPGYSSGRAINVVGYTALGASDDFFHEAFGATSFTFEGAEGQENRNFDRHTAMLDRVLGDQAVALDDPLTQGSLANPLRLAVVDEPSAGRLVLAASSARATSISLCRGAAAACRGSSPETLVTFSGGKKVGDRFIYSKDQPVSIASGDQLTLFTTDDLGKIDSIHSVRFERQ